MNNNIILSTDSYKNSHFVQYPPNTDFIHSYVEARGGKWSHSVVFGLQAFIKEYLLKPITRENIEEAEEFLAAHGLPFNREGWEYILTKHNGFLPLLIKAAPEGMLLPVKNVLATVVNTDRKCFWLTSYIETALLRAIWYPTTVATNSFITKIAIMKALNKSSDDPEGNISFRNHDFGSRGVSSAESAGLGGMAHLVNFMGSDTIEGVLAARRYYNELMAAYSLPASEHSSTVSWGRDHEVEAYRNMLKQFAKPGALVSIVADSYDLMNAVDNIFGKTLKQEIINSGATIIIRPDSGNPETTPIDVIKSLANSFGYSVNSKGYKVLANRENGTPIVRVIQGDGIDAESLPKILNNLLEAGFSAENLAFGMGGGLLQQVNRDTMKFAMKASAISSNGIWKDIYKDPKTDPSKASKRGRLALVATDYGDLITKRLDDIDPKDDLLETVFYNGQLMVNRNFSEIRERAHAAAIFMAKN